MNLRVPPGLFNPNATPLADLTLVAYVLLFLPAMLLGFYFARRHKFSPHHKLTMTFVTCANWLIILFVMAVSYGANVRPALPEGLAQPIYLLPTLHLGVGAVAQLLATYLLFRMWFEDVLPDFLLVKRIKPFMRLTLFLWFTTVVLGVILYVLWYPPSPAAAATPPPPTAASTPDLVNPVITPDVVAPVTTPELIPPAVTAEPGG